MIALRATQAQLTVSLFRVSYSAVIVPSCRHLDGQSFVRYSDDASRKARPESFKPGGDRFSQVRQGAV